MLNQNVGADFWEYTCCLRSKDREKQGQQGMPILHSFKFISYLFLEVFGCVLFCISQLPVAY